MEVAELGRKTDASRIHVTVPHVRGDHHSDAGRLKPYLAKLEKTPEDTFRRFLPESAAIRAGELVDAYQPLLSLDTEEDAVTAAHPPLPEKTDLCLCAAVIGTVASARTGCRR